MKTKTEQHSHQLKTNQSGGRFTMLQKPSSPREGQQHVTEWAAELNGPYNGA
jgi:hypothetical protein